MPYERIAGSAGIKEDPGSVKPSENKEEIRLREPLGRTTLDPRTMILLLVLTSVLAFTPKSFLTEVILVSSCALLIAVCGHPRMAFVWMLVFAAIVAILEVVFPTAPGIVSTTFTIGLTYARKIFLCMMIGSLLIRDVSIHRITAALQKWRIPQTLLIPFAVTMRYFPTLLAEARHIRDAMKLKRIPASGRIECFVVPLMVSATNTADELSAAAVCRGIENPKPSTDTERLHMRIIDWVVLGSFVMVAGILLVGGLW